MRALVRSFIFICACAVLLVACSSQKYRADIGCRELCQATVEMLDDSLEYVEYNENQIKYEFGEAARGANDICILYSVKVEDINEVGIFLAEDNSSAKLIAEDLKDYIEDLREGKRAFISSYAPDQLPKLDKADVRIYGNYVIYTVLDQNNSAKALDKIEERLTDR